MRNSGLIDADVDGISAWDDLTLTNEGRIEAGDDGVDAEDGLILTNSGTIDAGYWAVNAGEDADVTNAEGGELIADRAAIDVLGGAVIRNHGLIDGGYNGIYADDSLELTNTGRIEAEDHGGEAGDDAGITNSGSIRAQHDAINVDERATIVNATTGSIVSQHEDAIDLDSGTVLNYGLIRPVSGEAAIDFDDSEVAVSTITNHGTISGAVAINVALGEDEDPQAIENSAAQVVVNHGRIIGTDGTALQLGAGKDQIDIYSMDIEGLVDLGADDDTLIVRATVQNGVVYFASDPETIDMDEAPDTAIYDDMKLVVASRDSFAGMDAHVTEHALGLGKSALVPMPDATGDGLAFCEQGLGDGAWWATGSVGVFDGDGSGRLSLGRDGARAGVFLSYGRISATLSDGHDLISDSTLLGLHGGTGLPGGAQLVGIAYLGFGTIEMRSPLTASGRGSAETQILGLAGSVASAPSASGVSVVARAGIEHQRIGEMTMSGLGGASFGARDVTSGYVSAELRMEHGLAAGRVITPFLGLDVLFTDGEDVTMTLGSGSTRFATGTGGSSAQLILGAELGSTGQPWHLRIEGQYDDSGAAGGSLTAGLRF